MSSIFLNRASVARSITEALGASKGIDGLASGSLKPGEYMPETEGQYWQYRRYLHDIVCLALIDNGTFRESTLTLSKLGIHVEDPKLNRQKPDLYTMTVGLLRIGEVSVTYNVEREAERKRERYKDFISLLASKGITATLDVILLDLTDPEWRDSFQSLSGLFLQMIEDFIENLHVIHSDPRFGNVRASELGAYNTSRLQYVLEDETLVKQVKEATGLTATPEYIKMCLTGAGKDEISDKEYISRLASSIIYSKPHSRPYPEPRPVEPVTMLAEFEDLFKSKPTTSKLPKILQLGLPNTVVEKGMKFEEVCREMRETKHSGGYLDFIKASLLEANPDEESRIMFLKLPVEAYEKEQLEGPGRKAYLKRTGLVLPREAPKHIGVKSEHAAKLKDFIDGIENDLVGCSLKEIDLPSYDVTGLSLGLELEKSINTVQAAKASSVLTFYQRISNEIVLNSMRRRKSRQYVLGYSGVKDVYFLIAPGPQLRTEASVEFVKIISFVPPHSSGFCASWLNSGSHWESKWLSVDIDRLKHWQRSFDRVSLTLFANCERLVRPNFTFAQALKEEIAVGNYTLLALTYLEDKQLTSLTNQTLRYLWMKSIGDKDFRGLAAKFPDRVNSVIQSTILQRAVESCASLCRLALVDIVKVTRLSRDNETGLYDETTTGVTNLLPRIFTYGPNVPISYNLNEIYWCMAYNKDRQNAAQDALRILAKIVKEESKYDKEIGCRVGLAKVDYFLGRTSVEEDLAHAFSEEPESHYYSSKAVRVGLRLQDVHPENMGDRGSWLNSKKLEKILSKPLSDYATFKASVKTIAGRLDTNDLKEVSKIGQRTKAIELIAEIVENENLMTAAEVAMQFSGSSNDLLQILIQIFKKGQIGGVREIIILWIKARIVINITEEVCRLLCKSDKREILTKGRDKRLMMRGDHEEVTSGFPEGTPVQVVKESYDMTVWCQKFIPTIFTHIHNHHFKDNPGMAALSTHVFLAHSNKKIEFPKKLVEQWLTHKAEKHKAPSMEALKRKFLSDGLPYLVNHSNMCQGIPHYGSSVLGLSSISLGDELFHECLRQLGQEVSIKWKTRLGSDDKGTLIALDLSKPTSRFQARLLGQCVRVSERLHCMELSIKSASGHVMYELNSAFMANLETMSPTIKFSLAAVDSIETSSCSGFVQESYSRIRQLKENGCSSLVCQYAHTLNERHFYSVFDTGEGGTNNVRTILRQPRNTIPYDFGVYPMYDSDIQDIVGPEFYNYRILKWAKEKPNQAIKLLYTELNKREQDEMFRREDDDLLKKDHFGIQQGLVRQLVRMRERTNSKAEEVEKFFEKNPFIIVRGPENPMEVLMLVKSKLFTKGAAQSLRRTSPAIYIGRLAAYRSAKAWCFSRSRKVGYDIDSMEDIYQTETLKLTYADYLKLGLEVCSKRPDLDIRSLLPLLFPQHNSFEAIEQMVGKFGATKSTTKRYSQAVRTWVVNNFNYEFTSSLRSIMQTSFGLNQEATKEDTEEFKKLVNIRMDSLDAFRDDCRKRFIRPLDMFFYMTRIYKLSRTSRIQAFAHGPSTQSLHMTLLSLKRYNHMPGRVSVLDAGYEEDMVSWANTMGSKIDKIKFLHNLIIMHVTGRLTQVGQAGLAAKTSDGDLWEDCKTIIRGLVSISGFDFRTQKAIKLVAAWCLSPVEFKDKLVTWKDFSYTFIKKQKRHITSAGKTIWSGDLECLVSQGSECYTVCEKSGRRFIRARKISDLHIFAQSLKAICRTLDFEYSSFFKREMMGVGDVYLSDSTNTLHRCEVSRVQGNMLKWKHTGGEFPYRRIVDLSQFSVVKKYDDKSQVLTIHLESKEGRTTTVVHSLCNYYTLELPHGSDVDRDIFYQGVRLSALLENKDWFFNRRLPPMSGERLYRFHKEDVDFNVVLGLLQDEQARIAGYVEVREEVNEEAFGPLVADFDPTDGLNDNDSWDEAAIAESFRAAMLKEVEQRTLRAVEAMPLNWADEVEELEEKDKAFLSGLDVEETILVTRSFGYKKPLPRKNMFTISSLQQGAELRMRVLDSFFRMQSVLSEPSSAIPGYVAWIEDLKDLGELDERLSDALIDHLVSALKKLTGVRHGSIKEALDRNRYKTMRLPVQAIHSFVSGPIYFSNEAIMQEILAHRDDHQENFSDNDSLYASD